MVSDDGEQVPETTLNSLDPFRELGQPRREFREPLRFKCGVDNDAAAISQARHSELMNSRRGSSPSVAKNS